MTDYVLDPIRRDTDGDGITDATEIIGFKITPITGGTAYPVKTNPNNPDTDSDTFTDGFERLVGLDPTNGNDKDTDGDGLPDQVEEHGWAVGKETLPEVQMVTTKLDTLKHDPPPELVTCSTGRREHPAEHHQRLWSISILTEVCPRGPESAWRRFANSAVS